MKYAEKAREREKVWAATVSRVTLNGDSSGFISRNLGAVDPRPAMSDNDRERLMEYCRSQTDQSFPSDNVSRDELPNDIQDVFSDGFSADVDTLQEAATFLGLDPENATLESTLAISPLSALKLRVDEVQNVTFTVKKGEGILRGCINGNGCGTGKTIETLAAIYFMAMRKSCDPNAEHKPVLLLCPPVAEMSWQRGYAQFFASLLTLTETSLLSEEEVIRQVQAKPPGDPETSRQVLLFTFASFRTFLSKMTTGTVTKKTLSNPCSKLKAEQIEALRSSEKEILFKMHEPMGPGKFGICVVDEAHEIGQAS